MSEVGRKVYSMVRDWQNTKDRKLLEKELKDLLNSLIKTFKNKFEGRLHASLKRRQPKYKYEFSYESERIPYVIEADYIPDWPMKKANGKKMYIEAKGYFRPESKRKMVAVKKQHPELDIRIVFYSARKKDIRWAERYGFPYSIGSIPDDWLK